VVTWLSFGILQNTRRDGLYEIVGTVESASTIVPADTLTWRVVGGDDMIGYGEAATVETCHMLVMSWHNYLDRG
jgi:hypothetical protein